MFYKNILPLCSLRFQQDLKIKLCGWQRRLVRAGNSPEDSLLSGFSTLDNSGKVDYNITCTTRRCSSVVEQRIRNARVESSNLFSGSSKKINGFQQKLETVF